MITCCKITINHLVLFKACPNEIDGLAHKRIKITLNMIKKLYLIIFINLLAFPLYSQNNEENCDYARKKYLEENPDVLRAGLDPWMHYTVYGKNEKRKWHSCVISQSTISYSNNNPSVNGKSKFDKFDDFQTYFNSVNSSNIEFKGTINSNPPNPSESVYKTDYYNGKLIYEGYYKEVIKSNYGNVVRKEMLKHGSGKTYMTNSDGFLEGFYVNNKLNGYGTHRSPSLGYTYKGNFVNDQMHGAGVVINDGLNGTTKYIYEGNFNNNNYEGSGTIIYNFMSFVGVFENGKIKNGIAYYPRNEKYIGSFLNGNFNGNAEYYFSDGRKFIGGFSGGKFHSFGVLYYPDGSKKGGIWQQGSLLYTMNKYSENPVVYEYNSEYPYTSFVNGAMEVNRNSQKGVINPDGLEIVPCKYSILSYESDKIIGQIMLNGTMLDNMDVYDRKGNFIGNLSYSKELEKNRLERQRIEQENIAKQKRIEQEKLAALIKTLETSKPTKVCPMCNGTGRRVGCPGLSTPFGYIDICNNGYSRCRNNCRLGNTGWYYLKNGEVCNNCDRSGNEKCSVCSGMGDRYNEYCSKCNHTGKVY